MALEQGLRGAEFRQNLVVGHGSASPGSLSGIGERVRAPQHLRNGPERGA